MTILTPLTISKIREAIAVRKDRERGLQNNLDWGKEYSISVVYNTDTGAVTSVSITDTYRSTVKQLQTATVEELNEVLKILR